jgi:hypothetical protein
MWSLKPHQAYLYEVHPRFHHLVAPDIPERLQLAALYAATSSLLPEPTSRLTGAQAALQLLRQCWHNGSLSGMQGKAGDALHAQLQQVAALGGHLLPALHLVVEHLQVSMGYLDTYLYSGQASTAQKKYQVQAPHAAADAYWQQLTRQLPGGFPMHPSSQLTAAEEQELWQLGLHAGVSGQVSAWQSMSSLPSQGLLRQRKQQVPTCPIPKDYVDHCEQNLQRLVTKQQQAAGQQPYPLAPVGLGAKGAVLPLEEDMHNDLRASWEVHHAHHQQLHVSEQVHTDVSSMLDDVQARRQAAEHYLLEHLSLAPDTAGLPAAPWRLLKLSGLAPMASLHQLLPAAWSKDELLTINPLLSKRAVGRLHQGLMTWLQLCVLEDRLQRLQQLLVKQTAGVNCTSDIIKVCDGAEPAELLCAASAAARCLVTVACLHGTRITTSTCIHKPAKHMCVAHSAGCAGLCISSMQNAHCVIPVCPCKPSTGAVCASHLGRHPSPALAGV